MKMRMMRFLLVFALMLSPTVAKIGYFWHITDIHYDVNYTRQGDPSRMCWRRRENSGMQRGPAPGHFGHYSCDSPWALVQSAANAMKRLHGDNIEFVLWTGDAGGHASADPEQMLLTMQNLTDLLRHTFSSQFVFPALGHTDTTHHHHHHHHPHEGMGAHELYRRVASMWRVWLPNEALVSFEKGGYYSIEQKVRKLRLVALNTNLYARKGGNRLQALHPEAAASSSPGGDDDPGGQWAWLEAVLDKCMRNRETVYLIGHAAPGADERHTNGNGHEGPFQERYNQRYLQIVRKYASIIVGQFFGHLHADTFRVVYNENGEPVSWLFLSPSVSPWRPPSDSSNPGLRLYKFDTDTGQVLDYTQFYLDLNHANQHNRAEWQPEYNLTSHYGLSDVSPRSLHRLAESFRSLDDTELFERYVRANTVSLTPGTSSSHGSSLGSTLHSCRERSCQHVHYCAITRLGYPEYRRCIRDDAVWSGASSSSSNSCLVLVVLALVRMWNSCER